MINPPDLIQIDIKKECPVWVTPEAAAEPNRAPEAHYTDRSRVLDYHECPRKRYWGYEFYRVGIQLKAAAIPLVTGAHTHVGLEALLKGYQPDDAVADALAGYDLEVGRRGLDLDNITEDQTFVRAEQRALVEALTRAYAAYQLPKLKEDYLVLEVEKEDAFPFVYSEGRMVFWQARTDGLLRDKMTDDLVAMSFKTAAVWDRRKDAEASHDMQGLSEPAAVEYRRYPDRIAGVKMEYLIKGTRREYPESSGRWVTYNPLIRAWRLRGITPDLDRYSWKYQRAKGWETFNVWEADDIGGVKGWIEMILTGRVEPIEEDCLASIFVLNPVYSRRPIDTLNWIQQVSLQEEKILDLSAAVASFPGIGRDADEVLNRCFPQHTRSCDYPGTCEFLALCFGNEKVFDLIESGYYEWRIPNHVPEREHFRRQLRDNPGSMPAGYNLPEVGR